MTYYTRSGNNFRITPKEALDLQTSLPVGTYTLKCDMFGNFFLEIVDDFAMGFKLYGNITRNTDRIIRTFLSRTNSTGVILNGEKGSGKTLLAKNCSILGRDHGVSTIIVNQPFKGDNFNKFIQDIDQPCILIFDEFEKVYDQEDQQEILTLFDGVFPSQKLFILTCNDKWRIDIHMRNRPGRIFYMMDFQGLEIDFIREYCEDVLLNKKHIKKVCDISSMFDKFNFDMLKALVEEMNRYDESPQEALKMLNAKPEYADGMIYDIKIMSPRGKITEFWPAAERINPIVGNFSVCYKVAGKAGEAEPEPEEDQDEMVSTAPNKVRKSASAALIAALTDTPIPSKKKKKRTTSPTYELKITPKQLISIDASKGIVVYETPKGEVITATRRLPETSSYLDYDD